jgi:hypothetical protein
MFQHESKIWWTPDWQMDARLLAWCGTSTISLGEDTVRSGAFLSEARKDHQIALFPAAV